MEIKELRKTLFEVIKYIDDYSDRELVAIKGIADFGRGGVMENDIKLLRELKGRLVDKMVIESRRTLVNTNAINKCGEYIRVLSNAIQMAEEAEND